MTWIVAEAHFKELSLTGKDKLLPVLN